MTGKALALEQRYQWLVNLLWLLREHIHLRLESRRCQWQKRTLKEKRYAVQALGTRFMQVQPLQDSRMKSQIASTRAGKAAWHRKEDDADAAS